MPRVKVPRCARLLKLKLQGKAPFLGCNALCLASEHLNLKAFHARYGVLSPLKPLTLPQAEGLALPYQDFKPSVTLQGEPSARMPQQRQWL